MNEDEISARALDAWPAAEPPPGFADRVLSARRPGTTTPRHRTLLIAIAAGVALIAVIASLVIRAQRSSVGEKNVAARETIALGHRGLAVAEAGTRLSWTVSPAGEARIEQIAGDAFYRVEPGGQENIYANMPPILLGRIGRLVEARAGLNAARERMAKPAAPEA